MTTRQKQLAESMAAEIYQKFPSVRITGIGPAWGGGADAWIHIQFPTKHLEELQVRDIAADLSLKYLDEENILILPVSGFDDSKLFFVYENMAEMSPAGLNLAEGSGRHPNLPKVIAQGRTGVLKQAADLLKRGNWVAVFLKARSATHLDPEIKQAKADLEQVAGTDRVCVIPYPPITTATSSFPPPSPYFKVLKEFLENAGVMKLPSNGHSRKPGRKVAEASLA